MTTYPDEILLDKQQVIASLSDLPDKVSSEDLIERILFIRLIQERLQSVDEGNTVPHEQVMQDLREIKARKEAERSVKQP